MAPTSSRPITATKSSNQREHGDWATNVALQLAKNAIDKGAAGVDMGRNIFQADSPIGMLLAVREIVHNNATVDQAFDCYETYKNQAK